MLVENMRPMSNVEQLDKVSVLVLIKITLRRLIHTGEAFHSAYFCMKLSMTVVLFLFFSHAENYASPVQGVRFNKSAVHYLR